MGKSLEFKRNIHMYEYEIDHISIQFNSWRLDYLNLFSRMKTVSDLESTNN